MDLEAVLRKFTDMVPPEEISGRLLTFQQRLQKTELHGALLFHTPDIYYLAGTKQEGLLFVPAQGECRLFVIRHPRRAAVESPVPVVPLKSMKRLPELLADSGAGRRLGTEMDVITLSTFNRWKRILPEVEFSDVSNLIRETKAVKSHWEIETMSRAAEILSMGYQAMLNGMREGITESELASLVLLAMRNAGHEGGEPMRNGRMEGFIGHVLSGVSAVVPSYMNAPITGMGVSAAMPQGPGRKPIARGETVIFDYFGTCLGYIVDMTRTASLGETHQILKDAHNVLIDIHSHLAEALREGADGADVYDGVVDIARRSPYGDNFMGYDDVGVGFIGHGVGTEIDEYPFIARGLTMPLREGMVVAVEPKFLFPDIGAVGVENTYLIGKSGARALTTVPMELKVV